MEKASRMDEAAESPRFFRATLDALTSHIAILDEAGTILHVNEAWRRFADANGYAASDYGLGSNYLHSCDRGDGARQEGSEAAEGIRKVLAGELKLFKLEYPCHSHDEKRWFIMRVTRFDSQGPVLVVVEHQNITAEKLAREQLEALHAAISRSAEPVIWVRPDEEFRVSFANAAAARHFGLGDEGLVGKTVPEWSIECDSLDACERIWDRLRREQSLRFEDVHRLRDGREVPVEVSASYFRFADVEYITASFRDITERRKAEDALRHSEAGFRTLAESMPQLVWWTEADGAAGYFSSRWTEFTGQPAERATGDGWLEVLHPDDRARTKDAWQAAVRSGAPYDIEYRLRAEDGSYRWFLARALPLPGAGGRVTRWFGTCTDIDDQKLADRRKDEFLAVLGHELRNPLAPIRNAVQVLRLKGSTDPLSAQARDVIDRQSAHMSRLVDDLLEVSRITRGKIRLEHARLDVAQVVAQAVEASRALIESRRHELRVTLPDEPAVVHGDAVRLAQVMSNLLDNAAKYTEVGGRIEVAARREGEQVVLSVQDSGLGIPPEMLGRVFDMFAQVESSLDRAQGGLGIGLTLVRRLVEMHGGTVSAHSAGPGLGSTFVVRLPALADARPEAPIRQMEGDVIETTPRRVLVVDDNTDSAASLGAVLRLWKHEVEVAHDGPAALTAVRTFRPEVVLLDIGLPRMDGLQVAREVRQDPDSAQVVLVAMTGYGHDDDRRRTAEAGFDRHLVKPIDLHGLQQLLDSELQRKHGARSN